MKTAKILLVFILGVTALALGAAYAPDFSTIALTKWHVGSLTLAATPFGVVDATRGRAAYERVKQVAAKLNAMYKTNIIVNEDYFLSEQPVSNNISTYQFQTWDKVMQTDITKYPLQKGVKDNDVFIAIGSKLTIDNRVLGASAVQPQTYPSYYHFNTNTGNWKDLFSIYSGKWTLQVGRTIYISGDSTRKMLIVPQTQQSLDTNQSEFHGNQCNELDPYPVLSGRADNKLTLDVKLTTGWDGEGDNETQNVIGFWFNGITAQNAADYVEYFTGEKDVDAEWLAYAVKNKMAA